MAKAELPAVHIGSSAFSTVARNQSKSLGHADLPMSVVQHPFGTRSRDEVRSIARKVTEEVVAALLEKTRSSVAAAAGTNRRAELIEVPDDFEEFNRFFMERKWSDGLPLTPPTPERVQRMLRHTRRDPAEVVATLLPRGAATIEGIAINAVMAGCYPEYLPVLIAAAEAMGDKQFKLGLVQATTHPTTTWLIVNGPIAKRLGVNGGVNCLGSGTWANATLGRAVRLMALNIGGGIPGDVDPATHGHPGKFLMCCAENEAESPWEPLHVEQGYARDTSTVTLVPAKGTWSFLTHTTEVDDLLKVFGNTMMNPSGSEYRSGGTPAVVVSPEHAQLFARAGLSKAEFKRRLWEAARMPASMMSDEERDRTQIERRDELGEFGPDTLLPIAKKPEDIMVVVAGGPNLLSVYVPTQGPFAQAVTRAIDE